jgi:thiol-disulfide isomerase/thioredoxin
MNSIRFSLAFLFLLGFPAFCEENQPNPEGPRLRGTLLGGESFDLSRLRGKKVVLHFFATWCPACEEQMPKIEKVIHQHGEVELILITPETRRSFRDLKKFESLHPYKIALIEDLDLNEVGEGRLIPETLVLDEKGQVRLRSGPGDRTRLESELEREITRPKKSL